MAATEKPVTTDVPELRAFVLALRRLRSDAGLSYPEMARRSGTHASVLSRAAAGNAIPTWPTVERYVRTCGADLSVWKHRYDDLKAVLTDAHAAKSGWDDVVSAPTNSVELLRRLHRRIEDAGIGRTALADATHYSRSSITSELASCSLPPVSFLSAILSAIGASAEERARWLQWHRLLHEAAEPTPEEQQTPPDVARKRRPSRAWYAVAALIILAIVMPLASSQRTTEPGRSAATPSDRPSNTPSAQADRRVSATDLAGQSPTSASSRIPKADTPKQPPPKIPVLINHQVTAVIDVRRPDVGPTFAADQETTLRCYSTKGPTRGWYYTDGGYYVQQDDFRYAEGNDEPMLSCDQANFPEGQKPRPEGPCLSMTGSITDAVCLERALRAAIDQRTKHLMVRGLCPANLPEGFPVHRTPAGECPTGETPTRSPEDDGAARIDGG